MYALSHGKSSQILPNPLRIGLMFWEPATVPERDMVNHK